MKKFAVLIAAMLALPVGLGIHSLWLEPSSLHNSDFELAPPGWPPVCDGFKVALLADLHVGSPWIDLAQLAKVVETTNAAKPDLVLLAGDFVIHGVLGGDFVEPEAAASVLAALEAPGGVWAVLGNHDWWYDPVRVTAALEAEGIRLLEDTSTPIRVESCSFHLAGLSDFWEGPHDLDKALRGIPEEAPLLLFTHNPDVFPELPRRISLTLAGHTHGGQVNLPLLGRPIVPSRFGQRFAIGHIVEDGRHLFVNPGVGTSIVPIRFRVPPEISVLTLRSTGQ